MFLSDTFDFSASTHNFQETTESFVTLISCKDSTVTVTTTDACNTDMPVTAIIPVQIDGDAPSVNCSFTQGPFVRTTGPSRIEDLGFTYAASDNCGGLPLNVTVSIYSSEIENFNAQELALFYQDGLANPQAQLYLARLLYRPRTRPPTRLSLNAPLPSNPMGTCRRRTPTRISVPSDSFSPPSRRCSRESTNLPKQPCVLEIYSRIVTRIWSTTYIIYHPSETHKENKSRNGKVTSRYEV
jgi:hypothetical protein